MCTGGGGAPKAPQQKAPEPIPEPPAQPPPLKSAAAEVKVGAKDKSVSKRKKIGRSALKQGSSGSSSSSGLGS